MAAGLWAGRGRRQTLPSSRRSLGLPHGGHRTENPGGGALPAAQCYAGRAGGQSGGTGEPHVHQALGQPYRTGRTCLGQEWALGSGHRGSWKKSKIKTRGRGGEGLTGAWDWTLQLHPRLQTHLHTVKPFPSSEWHEENLYLRKKNNPRTLEGTEGIYEESI